MIQFSFDDGYPSDVRVVELLKKYGFTGTFYIPSLPPNGRDLLSMKDVKEKIVDAGMEIGGHTVSHPMDMKLLDDKQLVFEIEENIKNCILITGKHPTSFCYPRGRHDERVRAQVQKSGYQDARTTTVLHLRNQSNDRFQRPTTIHLFQRNEYQGVDWLRVAKSYFLRYIKEREIAGTFYHVWGHSYELDKYHEWERFEELLAFMKEYLSTTEHGAKGAIII